MEAAMDMMDQSTFATFDGAAGHDGILTDPTGQMIIKPTTKAEADFYAITFAEHSEFAECIPEFQGTLSLGLTPEAEAAAANSELIETAKLQRQQNIRGTALKTDVAVALENIEYGFQRPNTIDIKLGSKLYAEGTEWRKAERLDRVAESTTSGSLNFRIAGMKVWTTNERVEYDKQYGRKFDVTNVKDGFATFFNSVMATLECEEAAKLLKMIEAGIRKIRYVLQQCESRMYSASLLIVYEGDPQTLQSLVAPELEKPKTMEERPKVVDRRLSLSDDSDDDIPAPVTMRVKMIDFAHAEWTPGRGSDENVIRGLRNVEKQLEGLIETVRSPKQTSSSDHKGEHLED
ncbi:hypothetical protein LTR62_003891 [Meristemomyces frigidus]|uniref:Kinase n=1 Tax=Meristemomyces frigidus TaxID=1508187 RepID=A0AAN7YRH4_9PEZI|nr:hypothetical protein LTR62_003891 [Meristemomyces frigidus]